MKKIERAGYAVCVLLLLWIVASYIDTVSHNMSDLDYAAWNVFEIVKTSNLVKDSQEFSQGI